MTFGEKIQKLRKESGLSQEELAGQLEVSRQAVSKWERDSGYPETEKIVRMSRIFHVTLDYLLNDDNSGQTPQSASDVPEETGFYVSLETARGFLSHQKVKYGKIGTAFGIFIAGMAFCFMESEIGVLIFILLVIAGIVLLFSAKLSGSPYRRLCQEPLLFDKNVLSKLTAEYTDYKSKAHFCTLSAFALICVGTLFLPLLISTDQYVLGNVIMGASMVITGIGVFLCIYMTGTTRAYRLLVQSAERCVPHGNKKNQKE